MAQGQFLEGPAGVGKTTYAVQHIRNLLSEGISPESILVLIPHPALGQPYQNAFAEPDWPAGAQIDVLTFGSLARQGLQTFWPLIAKKVGFADPDLEPIFLTIETAQYYMSGLVNEAVQTGIFDSVSVTPFRIISQTLDNLSKSAVNDFSLDEVISRLVSAWGDRHSSRIPVYQASAELARRFREHCLKNSLVDFSLQIELFVKFLAVEPSYKKYFMKRYRHLIADNLEESVPVVGDFVRQVWPWLKTGLLIYDTDGGYRVFLGADPGGMMFLKELCAEVETRNEPVAAAPSMTALAHQMSSLLGHESDSTSETANPRDAFIYASHKFYPQMVDWVVNNITHLISGGVPPREIVVLAPFLGDSLRFTLTTELRSRGIQTVSHRPSRAVRDEPAARAILTLMALAYPEWELHPPLLDVSNALQQSVEGLDPVRAWLLAQIIYRPISGKLGSFDAIESATQQRITYIAGERYERLRTWLAGFMPESGRIPPDLFLSRLFGEVLSQPGFGFHTNLDAGRIVAELVESARRFRQTLYPQGVEDWTDISREYFSLVQAGMLAGLYVSSWRDEEQDAVFLAPAYTFLMRNRWVDYQFWLDAGSNYWWERLEQPLTHPYVLTRDYPKGQNLD